MFVDNGRSFVLGDDAVVVRDIGFEIEFSFHGGLFLVGQVFFFLGPHGDSVLFSSFISHGLVFDTLSEGFKEHENLINGGWFGEFRSDLDEGVDDGDVHAVRGKMFHVL